MLNHNYAKRLNIQRGQGSLSVDKNDICTQGLTKYTHPLLFIIISYQGNKEAAMLTSTGSTHLGDLSTWHKWTVSSSHHINHLTLQTSNFTLCKKRFGQWSGHSLKELSFQCWDYTHSSAVPSDPQSQPTPINSAIDPLLTAGYLSLLVT